MAIINVTRKNFSKIYSDKLDELGGMAMLAASLLGGKEKIKEALAEVPDEQLLWVNTDHVVAVGPLTKVSETGDIVFRIYFKYTDSKEDAIWIKGDDYKRFLLAWAGEERWVCEGEYNVPDGYRAIVCDDGSNIKVEKKEEL